MKKIIVFYHCAFWFPTEIHGAPPGLRPTAVEIITNQMAHLAGYGLYEAASEIIVGVNGGEECRQVASQILPQKATVKFHGLESKSETPTVVLLERRVRQEPDAYFFYFHSKGVTHTDPVYVEFVSRWRGCMMLNLVDYWQKCVAALDEGYDSAGCHWMTNMPPPSDMDSIWGGNFWWATGKFLSTLPPIMERPLIKEHGVMAPIARYESERWMGTGPRLPKVMDYHINGIGSCQ